MPLEFDNIEEALNSDAAKEAIQGILDNAKEGWDEDTAGLKTAKDKVLDELKKAKENLQKWDGMDNEAVKSLMDQVANNEEMKLLSEGKHDEVLERRTKMLKKDYEDRITALDTVILGHEKVITQKNNKLTELVIDGNMREAYVSLGFEPTAMRDQIRSGREVFKMDDEGNAVPRDTSGNIIFGTDGKTPMSPTEWLKSEAETKKYLQPASNGSGASHQRGQKGSGFDSANASSIDKIRYGLEKRRAT